ncbi:MAG: beta-ketoacyl-[acyl-carrier-protein] synthase family protein [Gemmataceae bacterium]
MKPVWITGTGICSPLGNNLDQFADAILAGRSAVSAVHRFDASQHPSQIAAQIDVIPVPSGWDAGDFSQLDEAEQLIAWCCTEALQTSGLWDDRDQKRIGIVMGLGSEWMMAWESDGLGQMRPQATSAVEAVAKRLHLTGPSLTLSAACASGNYAFAVARSWIRMGLVDACIAGGCDRSVTPLILAGFGNLRALSRRNDAPAAASRPFDRGRDGFVLGEGGAACLLESAASARQHGAAGLAEVAGFGATSDAHHIVIPCPDTTAAANAMQHALDEARVSPSDVGYINAHGTGTPVGDVCETKALRRVFGSSADQVPVSSTKSMTGHLLTGAAAVEALAGVAAIQRGAIPPTINLDDPDPECALNHVAHTAREQKVSVVMSNSFGFGGSNTSLVLRSVV